MDEQPNNIVEPIEVEQPQPLQRAPVEYVDCPMIWPDNVGPIVGMARNGQLLFQCGNERYISGYTLEGYGVENLTDDERKALGL